MMPNDKRPFLSKLIALFVTCAVLHNDMRNRSNAMLYLFMSVMFTYIANV